MSRSHSQVPRSRGSVSGALSWRILGNWADVRKSQFNPMVLNHKLFFPQGTSDYHNVQRMEARMLCNNPNPTIKDSPVLSLPELNLRNLASDPWWAPYITAECLLASIPSLPTMEKCDKDLHWCLTLLFPKLWRSPFLRDSPLKEAQSLHPSVPKPWVWPKFGLDLAHGPASLRAWD